MPAAIESSPRVAVGHLREERQRLVTGRHVESAQPQLDVDQSPLQQCTDVFWLQRLEFEDLAARNQGRDEREEGVGGGGPDQPDDPALDIRQQHILLRAVEVVQFVDEQQRPSFPGRQAVSSRLEQFSEFLDPGGGGVETFENTLGLSGNQFGQGRLPRSGGAVEDGRAESRIRRSSWPGPRKCCCPTNSSRFLGRMRAASGRARSRLAVSACSNSPVMTPD